MIRKHWSIIELGYKQSFAYRADFFIGCVATLLKMLILAYIWTAVYRGAGSAALQGRTLQDTITYVLLGQALWSFIDGNIEVLLGVKIRHGEVARDLLKPMGFQTQVFLGHFGFSLTIFLIQTLPALLIAMFLFPVHQPASGGNLVLAMVSAALGFVIYTSLSFFIGVLGFWTKNVWGLGLLKKVVISALSGNLLPLYFYPEFLRKWVYLLPFKEIIHTPLSIYQGTLGTVTGSALASPTANTVNTTTGEVLTTSVGPVLLALANQALWAALLLLLSHLSWRYLKREIEIFGG